MRCATTAERSSSTAQRRVCLYREELAKYYQSVAVDVNEDEILVTTGGWKRWCCLHVLPRSW